MLCLWIEFYDNHVDQSLQPHLFHTPTEAYKTTSMMDCRTYGL